MRLIGRHDAVFLFVVYTLFTVLFTLVDVCSRDFRFGLHLWYLGYATYTFARLMEQKQSQGKGLWALSFLSVVAFIVVYMWTMKMFSVNPHPERTFPLYQLQPPSILANSTISNETAVDANLTAMSNMTAEVAPEQY